MNDTPLERYLGMLPHNPGGGGMVRQSAIIWHHLLSRQLEDGIQGDMGEIGVFRGFGASLMAGYLRPAERLTLVDLLCGLDLSVEAIREVAGPDVLERIVFHQTSSHLLRRSGFTDKERELRFVHIDGEHSYDGVITDLKLVQEHLSWNSIVVIDDFFSEASPGITHAVFDFVKDQTNGLALFLIGYNKAYLCLNRSLGYYREISSGLPDVLEAHGHMAQLAAGGFAHERTYFGISERATADKYQLIGHFIPGAEQLLSSTNRY